MIQPTDNTEKLLYTTIKIETNSGSGTGFLFHFIYKDKEIPVIITNKHVVENEKNISLTLHIADANNLATDENIKWDYQTNWIEHPKYDLCCSYFQPIIDDVRTKLSKKVFYAPLDESLLTNINFLETQKTVENVLMIGYPIGLHDEVNNFPLFRTGITSTHPSVKFQGDDIGVVDLACFPGSSGSPLILYHEGTYVDKYGTTHVDMKKFGLLGVLYAGPTYTIEGEIVVREIPVRQNIFSKTNIMINLGYYIKSYEILELKKILIIDVEKN